jgi:CheY-like chemotaxis protein
MTKPKILLVDDVDFFLEVEKGFLRRTPVEILVARNGREALEIASGRRPDVIFMDVEMPVMDGLTCLKKLKADPQLRSIPVVMVFAPSKEADENVCRAAGADAVLHKPLVRNAFLELGRRFLFDVDRREKRISCQALVTLNRQGEKIHCVTEDLSAHGAYINCRQALREGERVKVTMVLPGTGARVIECRGRVAWVNHGFPRPQLGLPQGFGLEFQDLDREVAEMLRDLVEGDGEPVGLKTLKGSE